MFEYYRDYLTDPKKKKMATIGLIAIVVVIYLLTGGIQTVQHGGLFEGESITLWKVLTANFRYGPGLFFVFLLISAGVILFVLYDRYDKNKNMDERGFKKSTDGTYGTADWMSPEIMRKEYSVGDIRDTDTFILGRRGGEVISVKPDTRLNPHISVFGVSGSGKTWSTVKPNLFQAIRRGESCLITDPKGELYNDTSELFRKCGYEVKVFNLVSPDNSDKWNCMCDLGDDTLLASLLVERIISNTSSNNGGDEFWTNGESMLLKALILYVAMNDELYPAEEDKKNLAEVYSLLTSHSRDELSTLFDALPSGHPAKEPWNLIANSGEKVQEGFMIGLGSRLQILQDKKVKELVSKNEIDITAPGKRKCAYFVIISAQDSTMKFLSSLFFSLFFTKEVRYGDTCPKGRLPVPVNVMLDEFCNIGTIGGAGGEDFAKIISVVRSYGLKIMMIIQSLGQLQNRYQKNVWSEILGNCDTQIFLGCTDELTAEFISEKTGTMTIDTVSEAVERKTIAIAQFIPQYRENTGKGKRAVLTPDEVLRLPNDNLLIFTRSQNVLKAEKYGYDRHPMSKYLSTVDIYSYQAKKEAGVYDIPPDEYRDAYGSAVPLMQVDKAVAAERAKAEAAKNKPMKDKAKEKAAAALTPLADRARKALDKSGLTNPSKPAADTGVSANSADASSAGAFAASSPEFSETSGTFGTFYSGNPGNPDNIKEAGGWDTFMEPEKGGEKAATESATKAAEKNPGATTESEEWSIELELEEELNFKEGNGYGGNDIEHDSDNSFESGSELFGEDDAFDNTYKNGSSDDGGKDNTYSEKMNPTDKWSAEVSRRLDEYTSAKNASGSSSSSGSSNNSDKFGEKRPFSEMLERGQKGEQLIGKDGGKRPAGNTGGPGGTKASGSAQENKGNAPKKVGNPWRPLKTDDQND